MSFQATKFVRALRGLTPAEKAVAFVLADHANQYGGNSFPSMDLIAEEAGFKDRRSAQRYMRRLEEKKVVVAMSPKTGGHGHDTATIYRLDFGYEPTTRCDSTAAPPDANLDDGGVTVQTVRGDSTGPEGRQHSRSKKYEEGDKREWAEATSSSVQKPHTPILGSLVEKNDEGEIKPDQTSVPPPPKRTSHPNHPVQSSKIKVAAAPPTHGSPEWWAARKASMSDEEKVSVSIALIQLTKNRTFKCNGRIEQIVRAELANGVPWEAIVDAARDIGNTLDECDRWPGDTLAKNLSATIAKLAVQKLVEAEKEAEEQRRIEKSRQETDRLNRESAARQEIKREEAAALRERSDWGDCHGSDCPGFVSTNPSALYRADLEARIEQAYRDHSNNYSILFAEARKLETEAVEARLMTCSESGMYLHPVL